MTFLPVTPSANHMVVRRDFDTSLVCHLRGDILPGMIPVILQIALPSAALLHSRIRAIFESVTILKDFEYAGGILRVKYLAGMEGSMHCKLRWRL